MTNQEAYEELCDKAEKYDKLVKAIEDIKADLETNTEKWWYGKNNDCFIKLSDVLETIAKHTKELL